MKFIIFFSLIFSMSILSFGQISADSKLSARFTSAQIADFETNQGFDLKFWNYYVNHCFEIHSVGIKTEEYPNLNTIVGTDPSTNLPFDVTGESPLLSNFNPLKYDIPLSTNQKVIYKVDSDKVIFFLSKEEIIQSFNELYN